MSATVKHIPSTSSGNLDTYLEREKEGNDLPRVLYEYGQHCRPETAAQEFRALRETYGQQGAVRRVSGRYVEPEDPVDATHLKVGKNWREAKEGESATHLRIAPAVPFVKRDEAHHFVFSFDLATVNPEDPEETRRAFDAVVAFREEYTPGTQSKFVAHGDALGSKDAIERGEGGKFHVHEAMNAVVYEDMLVEGRQYRRGQRVAGAITHVDTYRTAWDDFLERRGHEFGLGPQDRSVLPEVGSPEYRAVRRTEQDYWARQGGEISDHDRARRGMETAYARLAEDPARLLGLSDAERVEVLAAEAAATGDVELKLRRTKAGEVKIRSFAVPGRNQAIGATKLGERYANATATAGGVGEQLERIAAGTWEPYARGEVGPPKEIERLPEAEVAELQQSVDGIAAEEHETQATEAVEQRAKEHEQRRQQVLASPPGRFAGLDEDELTALVDEKLGAQPDVSSIDGSPVRRPDQATLLSEMSFEESEYLVAKWHELGKPETAAERGDVAETPVWARVSGAAPTPDAVRAERETAGKREKATARRRNEAPEATPQEDGSNLELEPQPDASDVAAEQVAPPPLKRTAKRPVAHRQERRATHLTPEERRSAELIAVVRSERADGGAYVDFQLAAPEPGRGERSGLHLIAAPTKRTRNDGSQQEVTQTWTQLTAEQYKQLKFAAGDNRVEAEGKTVYGLASDLGVRTSNGHTPIPNSFQSSARKPIGEDVLAKQRASEDRGREAVRAEKERRKNEPAPLKTVSKDTGDLEPQRGVSRSRLILEGR